MSDTARGGIGTRQRQQGHMHTMIDLRSYQNKRLVILTLIRGKPENSIHIEIYPSESQTLKLLG